MSEVALTPDDRVLAHSLIAEIAGHCWRGKGDMIDRVYQTIVSHLPTERADRWTRRRVRSFWHKEAAGVRYYEMIELAAVAQAETAKRENLEEAKRSHAEFVMRTARLATALAVQDEEFHRESIEALSRITGAKDDLKVRRAARAGHEAVARSNRASGAVDPGDGL